MATITCDRCHGSGEVRQGDKMVTRPRCWGATTIERPDPLIK